MQLPGRGCKPLILACSSVFRIPLLCSLQWRQRPCLFLFRGRGLLQQAALSVPVFLFPRKPQRTHPGPHALLCACVELASKLLIGSQAHSMTSTFSLSGKEEVSMQVLRMRIIMHVDLDAF